MDDETKYICTKEHGLVANARARHRSEHPTAALREDGHRRRRHQLGQRQRQRGRGAATAGLRLKSALHAAKGGDVRLICLNAWERDEPRESPWSAGGRRRRRRRTGEATEVLPRDYTPYSPRPQVSVHRLPSTYIIAVLLVSLVTVMLGHP